MGNGQWASADQEAHQSKSVIFIKFDGVCWSPAVEAADVLKSKCLLSRAKLEEGVKIQGASGKGLSCCCVMKQKLIQDNCSLDDTRTTASCQLEFGATLRDQRCHLTCGNCGNCVNSGYRCRCQHSVVLTQLKKMLCENSGEN